MQGVDGDKGAVKIEQGEASRTPATSLRLEAFLWVNAMRVLAAQTSTICSGLACRPRVQLSYPYYFLRRTVRLSEISDANCQTYSKQVADLLSSILLGGNRRKTSKHYVVNLSGDFGARRIVFRSKYKRDQFLSLIRAFAPQVRITRWS
ncbi:hypothetical protein [Bradyrhizobium brasilense]|uniref:hypothetical protein n=1 Tax=Bradyrhizobium brasilense TaxID=1419277 RepID=UPI001E319A54|nr:hypothetical protein [Bradyrhizobium brasilense]MCC8971208.1 hypothetical protein [Bradyrhizobium brasilense]